MKKPGLLIAFLALIVLSTSCTKEDLVAVAERNPEKDDRKTGSIFVLTNNPDDNQVIRYLRNQDGSVEMVGATSTGGMGANLNPEGAPTFNDPLGSQDPLIVSYDEKFVFAVNSGSNTISSLRITGKSTLKLVDEVDAYGIAPVSLTTYRDLLYVVNARDGGNISGYKILPNGRLEHIEGSSMPLSQDPAVAGNIEFSPDGKFLIVSEKNTSQLSIFPIMADGSPGPAVIQPSNGMTPFGADVTENGTILISEAFGGAADASKVSSYNIQPDGTLALVSGSISTNETAACWIELTDDDRYAYTSNTPDGTLSSFSVMSDGSIQLLESIAGDLGAGAFVLDAEVTDEYLFVIAATFEEVSVFKVEGDGSLTFEYSIQNDMFVAGEIAGLAGI